jgi:hypothetical protein
MKAIPKKVITSAVDIQLNQATIKDAIFQHSVLCQTYLPYRDLGKDVSVWEQKNGKAHLAIQALQQRNAETERFETVGLPFGVKGRLILTYLNSQAIKLQSPRIEVEQSMTGFIKALELTKDGRTIAAIKEQLKRINSSVISVAYSYAEGRTVQSNMKLVKMFDVSFQKNASQRVIWKDFIELDKEYFESLLTHAVPMDERALLALSHNALAMDIYAWLCQRLHRIKESKPDFVDWVHLKEQFGSDYTRIRKFREKFLVAMEQAISQYKDAKVEVKDTKGLLLHHSQTAIPSKIIQL